MANAIDVVGDILSEASALSAALTMPDRATDARTNMQVLAGRLRGHADRALAGPFAAAPIRSAVAAARAALELETAARALGDAEAQSGRAAQLLGHMGYAQCLAALGPLAREMAPVGDVAAHPFEDALGVAQARGAIAGAKPGAAADLRVLRDISYVHRQHARYHSLHKYDQARELAHESHKLKTLADLWLAGGGAKPLADVDFSDPRYRAAPCSDLNAPDAIPNIGFLFLEGAGKPPELTILQDRLVALAADIEPFGTHLVHAMDAAWLRESALLAPDKIEIAWTRLLVVLCNWRAGHDSELAGRLTARCAAELASLDLTPQGVRADMKGAGARLTAIGWVLDIAAQLCASAGLTLADNNWRYTQYSEFLDRI
jgi:hypothetical protein